MPPMLEIKKDKKVKEKSRHEKINREFFNLSSSEIPKENEYSENILPQNTKTKQKREIQTDISQTNKTAHEDITENNLANSTLDEPDCLQGLRNRPVPIIYDEEYKCIQLDKTLPLPDNTLPLFDLVNIFHDLINATIVFYNSLADYFNLKDQVSEKYCLDISYDLHNLSLSQIYNTHINKFLETANVFEKRPSEFYTSINHYHEIASVFDLQLEFINDLSLISQIKTSNVRFNTFNAHLKNEHRPVYNEIEFDIYFHESFRVFLQTTHDVLSTVEIIKSETLRLYPILINQKKDILNKLNNLIGTSENNIRLLQRCKNIMSNQESYDEHNFTENSTTIDHDKSTTPSIETDKITAVSMVTENNRNDTYRTDHLISTEPSPTVANNLTTTKPSLSVADYLTTTEPFSTVGDNLTTTESFSTTTQSSPTVADNLTTTGPFSTTTQPSPTVADNLTTTESFSTVANNSFTTEPSPTVGDKLFTTESFSTVANNLTTTEPSTTVDDNLFTTESSPTVTDNLTKTETSPTFADDLHTTGPFSTTSQPSPTVANNLFTTEPSPTSTGHLTTTEYLTENNNFITLPPSNTTEDLLRISQANETFDITTIASWNETTDWEFDKNISITRINNNTSPDLTNFGGNNTTILMIDRLLGSVFIVFIAFVLGVLIKKFKGKKRSYDVPNLELTKTDN